MSATSQSSNYNIWAQVANNADIALLKTAGDLHWNEYVWPVCPPSTSGSTSSSELGRSEPSADLEGQMATVLGWGKRSEARGGDYSDRLQKATLQIVGGKQCAEWFRLAGRELVISEKILCAGWREGGRDSCHGDSGGPLLIKGSGKK